MMIDPNKQIPQPIFPKVPNFSLRNMEAKIAPMMTERAPNGVTKIGGAKVYAAKLAISPTAIIVVPNNQSGFFKYVNDSPLEPSLSNPIFVKTKLVPIANEDEIANANPMYLSSIF